MLHVILPKRLIHEIGALVNIFISNLILLVAKRSLIEVLLLSTIVIITLIDLQYMPLR